VNAQYVAPETTTDPAPATTQAANTKAKPTPTTAADLAPAATASKRSHAQTSLDLSEGGLVSIAAMVGDLLSKERQKERERWGDEVRKLRKTVSVLEVERTAMKKAAEKKDKEVISLEKEISVLHKEQRQRDKVVVRHIVDAVNEGISRAWDDMVADPKVGGAPQARGRQL
jgi:hypothetical protein